MNKKNVILTAAFVAIICIASVYGACNLLNTAEPSTLPSPSATSTSTPTSTTSSTPEPTSFVTPTTTPMSTPTTEPTPTPTIEPQNTTLTVTDVTGTKVTVNLPVKRIVSLTSGLTEIVCALGGENLLVGRGQYSTFPPSVISVPVAGSTSASPNVEVIFEMEPDVVLADTMIVDRPELAQIRAAGIPVIIENPANLSRVAPIINTIGVLVNNQTRTTALINWMNQYLTIVSTRLANIQPSQMPSVYIEYNTDWSAFGSEHPVGQLMSVAGGRNIITNTSLSTIKVSPEYVIEKNPQFIFKMTAAGKTVNATYYQGLMATLFSRVGFAELDAIKNNHAYLFDYSLIQGLRYPVGQVYFAKCMYPELFADVDPTAMLVELNQKFFGISLEGVYVYP